MKLQLSLAAVALTGLAALAPTTRATAAPVATISGCYDCGVFDTPSLVFNNTTGGSLTNAQLLLTGYQGQNDGISQTVTLGTLGGGSTQIYWGSIPGAPSGTTPGNLTAGDYDDEYIGTSAIIPTTNCSGDYAPDTTGGGSCAPGGGPQWYAQVGNFDVVFTALVSGGAYGGQDVYSVFSPTTNATGGFVGWEGIDPQGYSESPNYDVHTGSVTGDMADIFLGLPPPPTTVPEPLTLSIFGAGVAFTALRRRRKAKKA